MFSTTKMNRSTPVERQQENTMDKDRVPLKDWLLVLGVVLGAFMAVLDIQITNSSLRDIQGALAATVDEGTWITTAYLIAEIIVIPLTGWLSQVFSTRRYLLVNATLFVIFSMLCGTATSLPWMIVFRALQGFTGGVLIPMALSTILTVLPKSKQPVGLALFATTATFSPTIGPTLGGLLTDSLGWRYIFFINLIPGIFLLAAVWFNAPKRPMQLNLLKNADYPGIITMAIGLSSLEFFLEEGNRNDWLGSPLMAQALAIAVIFLTAFMLIQVTSKNALLNLSLFKQRTFSSAAVINVILGVGLYGSVYIIPSYLGQVQNYSAFQIGQTMLWLGLPQLFLIPLVPWLMKRFDLRLLIGVGICLFALSCVMNSVLTHDSSGPQLIAAQLIRALGQPLIFVPLSTVATANVQPNEAGGAASLFNMMRNLGGSFGIAAIATLLNKREHFHSNHLGQAISSLNLATQARIDEITHSLTARGIDFVTAQQQSLTIIEHMVRREAFVLAYADCFKILAMLLFLSACAIMFMGKVRPGISGSNGGH
jgi:DHA2 family multidrug resistance protein